MKHVVAIKNGSLGITAGNLLNIQISRLSKKLENFADDLTELKLFIKKHDRHHFYTGVFTLRLPKKALVANVGAHSLEEILREGFSTIEKEFETYKGKHFKGSSKYANHETVREA